MSRFACKVLLGHAQVARTSTSYARWKSFRLWFALIVIFLYAPILNLIIFSFNNSKHNVVWRGFSLKYYLVAWRDTELTQACINSFTIAFIATLLSVILGTLAAYTLWRFRFLGKGLFRGVLILPIIAPEVCMGIAMLLFFSHFAWINELVWPLSLIPIIIAHTVFGFPFVTFVVYSRLSGLDRMLIEAAWDLGAREMRIFFTIIVPSLWPALLAGALLAFSLSLDDFLITFFVAGPGIVTLPLKIFSMLRFSITPEINAASTILVVITLVAAFFALKLQKMKNIF